MTNDVTPQTRMVFRSPPGTSPIEKRTIGRMLWIGTTRFLSFLGGAARPVAEAWHLAGGPGGQGAVVLANFLQKFGHPAVQHMNEKVSVPRVNPAPGEGLQTFNQMNNEVRISTEMTEGVESHLADRFDVLQRVNDTRYDAVTDSAADFE